MKDRNAFQRWLSARTETSPRPKPFARAEALLDSVNDTSKAVGSLHVGFVALYAYVAVVIWSTTHEDLVRVAPIKLPLLQTELSLTGFFQWVPWLVVLLHFNLLLQLYLLSRKLWSFRAENT